MSRVARNAEHPLHPGLAGIVEAAWSVVLDDDAPALAHRVLPDGCIDLVLRDGAAPLVVGPMTGATFATMAAGSTVRGLRFRPGAAPFALETSAQELRDLAVPLADVLAPSRAAGLGHRAGVAAVVAGHGGPADLVALQRLVLARTPPATDPLVDAAVARLRRAPGLEIGALARELAVSPRQLRRRFHVAVGYGPKRLARVLRLQRLLALGRAAPDALGVELAFACGYADEAHMGRETRELAGLSAQALLRERGRSVQAPGATIVQAA
jgi:AraC-like DNA-binding protein